MMVVLFGVMWLLLIRPQRKRQQAAAALIASIKPGDEVMTAGGLYGTIVDLDIEEVILEIAPGTNVRVDKRAIANVVEEEVEDEVEAEAEAEEATPEPSERD